jgi:hypothetical protein
LEGIIYSISIHEYVRAQRKYGKHLAKREITMKILKVDTLSEDLGIDGKKIDLKEFC